MCGFRSCSCGCILACDSSKSPLEHGDDLFWEPTHREFMRLAWLRFKQVRPIFSSKIQYSVPKRPTLTLLVGRWILGLIGQPRRPITHEIPDQFLAPYLRLAIPNTLKYEDHVRQLALRFRVPQPIYHVTDRAAHRRVFRRLYKTLTRCFSFWHVFSLDMRQFFTSL